MFSKKVDVKPRTLNAHYTLELKQDLVIIPNGNSLHRMMMEMLYKPNNFTMEFDRYE